MKSHGRDQRSLFVSSGFDEVFEHAGLYRSSRMSWHPWCLREPGGSSRYGFSERHLQCLWYDNRYRPDYLKSSQGLIRIIHPGEWNTGPGPDFLNARMVVLPEGRALRGDVEIHIRPADWIHHGHHEDPAYDGVVVHVTWSRGTLSPLVISPSVATICLEEDHPELLKHVDCMDIAAYPTDIDVSHSLRTSFESLSVDQASLLMLAAGHERLRRKSVRLSRLVDEVGSSEALYQEIMAALGYRAHSACFRSLARVVPLHRLQRLAAGNVLRAYALLLGSSGLLPRRMEPEWDEETVEFVRTLWDYWWPHAGEFESYGMHAAGWLRGQTRPQNRPERRLLAAADLFTRPQSITSRLHCPDAKDSAQWHQAIRKELELRSPLPYWGGRLKWGGRDGGKALSLLGRGRANAIIQNVVVPYAAARNLEVEVWRTFLQDLPSEDGNAVMRKMALLLLGRDHNAAEYADGIRKQGLMQIYQDTALAENPESAARELVDWVQTCCERENVDSDNRL